MLRFFSTSIVRQAVAITLGLLVVSTGAIVAVTYYDLSRYVMDNAVADARDASRTMAILYGAGDGNAAATFACLFDPRSFAFCHVRQDMRFLLRFGGNPVQNGQDCAPVAAKGARA